MGQSAPGYLRKLVFICSLMVSASVAAESSVSPQAYEILKSKANAIRSNEATDGWAYIVSGGVALGLSIPGYYLSKDSTITVSDLSVGSRWINNLGSGASSNGSTKVTIPLTLAAGTYYLGAIADFSGVRIEQNENNNTLSRNITIVK